MYQLLIYIIVFNTPYKTLTWEDFKMKPPQSLVNKGYRAMTNTQWNLIDSTDGKKHWYIVEDWFNQDSSWTVTSSLRALSHEQGHYDISKLWANKLRDSLAALKGTKSSKASDMFDHCWKEQKRLQEMFDKETRNGLNEAMERQWEEQIKKDIK